MNWVCLLNHRRREDCAIECLRNQVAGLELDIAVYKRDAEATGRIAIELRKQVVELVEALERARAAFITNGDQMLDTIYDDYINRLGMSVDFKECYAAQITDVLAKARTAQFDASCLKITEN